MPALELVSDGQAPRPGTFGPPDLRQEAQPFASLIGSLGAAEAPSPSGSGRAVDLGRGGADDRKRTTRRPSASADPTQVAVAELGSRGQPKETVAAAMQDLTNPGRTGEPSAPSRTPRAPGGETPPDSRPSDRRESREVQNGVENTARPANASSAGRATVDAPIAASAPGPTNPPARPLPSAALPPVAVASSVAGRIGKAGPVAGLERAQPAPLRTNLRVVSAPAAASKPSDSSVSQRALAQAARDEDTEFAEQLERGFAAVLRQNGGSLTMRLQPEALGELTIRMDLKPGQVAAAFEVESDQAQRLLGSRLSALRSALEARGLNVDSLTVEVSQRPTQDAKAEDQAETWQQGGAQNPGGGAVGEDARGQRHDADGRGTDATPEKAGIHSRSEDVSWSTAGAGAEALGGARVVRLAIDAIA